MPGADWTTSGDAPWQAEITITHDGSAAAQSGAITGGQQSVLSTWVNGPGTLSFWWRVSSETNNDYESFSLDGLEQFRVSGLVNTWQHITCYVAAGVHTLAWAYSKNATVNAGSDAAWLDQVSYVPGVTAASIVSGPTNKVVALSANAEFDVVAQGTPPLTYQWFRNGSVIPGATNATLIVTNAQVADTGRYAVSVHNDYGDAPTADAFLNLISVSAWGAGKSNSGYPPNYGQSIVPDGLTGIAAVAGGVFHTLALRTNGQVIAWGMNINGQSSVPSTLTNVTGIAGGHYYSMALKGSGAVVGWGNSGWGEASPPALTNASSIAAGWYHGLALCSNGTVVAWGAGKTQGSSPHLGQSMVPTNLAGVKAIAAGGYHSLALCLNGTVVAWGWNASGQTNVPATLSNVIAIAAGGSNSVALKNDGTLVAWGANEYGQCNIPAGLTNVVGIAAGAAHVMALRADGTLAVWGLDGNGQADPPSGLTNIAAISAGGYHSLALLNAGPATILSLPCAQSIFVGSNASFSVTCLGTAPLAYQWLRDGVPLEGRTTPSLVFSNAQFTDAGNYQVSISNVFGAVTSSVAALAVNDTAPHFIAPPTNTFVIQNSKATLIASAGGLPPLSYQWLFNATPLSQRTNLSLTISNAQLPDEGFYSLVVSNAVGLATSSVAFLDVVDVPQALGPTNLSWLNSGSPAWFAESTNTHDGFAAAAAGPLSTRSSSLRTYVTGPGKLTFWWTGQQAVMSFQIDDIVQTNRYFMYSGMAWEQRTYYLPAKVHALTWTAGVYQSPTMGFLDQVTFTPGITPVAIDVQPAPQSVPAGTNVTLSISVSGAAPFTYQWYFNSNPIPGAASASLNLYNVQSDSAGSYSVVVSGPVNTAVSSNAVLTVRAAAAAITSQPVGGNVVVGSSFTFAPGTIGTSPVSYQWLLNGQPLPAATRATLTLDQVNYSDAGNYSLFASNALGMTISSNALLLAYSFSDLGTALDAPDLVWTTTNPLWFPEMNTTHSGGLAGQSGVPSYLQPSTLQTTVTGPAMVVYWWKVNCDGFFDNLSFIVNGSVQNSIGGAVDWCGATNVIGAGPQVLQWSLGSTFNPGTGWVDTVQIIPIAGTGPSITTQPAGTSASAGNSASFSATAAGTPTLLYQWQFEGADLPGATNSTLTLYDVQGANAGTYTVRVTNDFGFTVSSNATLAVSPSGPAITQQLGNQTNVINNDILLTVATKGTRPMTYQWYFNGAVFDQTSSNTLVISGLQFSNAGNYSVVVSNSLGQVTSSVARLTVTLSKVLEFWPGYLGRYPQPSDLGRVTAIAVGTAHTMALRDDGTLLVWGDNSFGQTNVPVGLSSVVAISAGNNHCLALRADGTLAVWGDNGYGQGAAPAGISNVVGVSCGPSYNLVLMRDGTVAGWGNDVYGQTDIPAGLTNVRSVYAGYYNGFALMPDGNLVQWGSGPIWQHNGSATQLNVAGSNIVGVAAGALTGWTLQDDSVATAYGFFDGSAPFTNSYRSLTSWSYGTRPRDTFPGALALAASGNGDPTEDYLLLLSENGSLKIIGGLGGPSSHVPSIPYGANYGNVAAISASYMHAAALINDGSPFISGQPLSRVAYSGDTVVLKTAASGRAPLNYQWQLNGTDIASATAAVLVLTNVPLSAAGNYSCRVTSGAGSTTTASATLTVLRSTPQFSGAPIFSGTGLDWKLDQLSGHGSVLIYASTNLVDWVPLATNQPVTGSIWFHDPFATNQVQRFYRAVEQ